MERGFQVTVRGRLETQFATLFGPAVVEARGRNTTVRGRYVDQSNLDGILAYFSNLGMELVAVETWDEPGAESATSNESIGREREQ